jgi:hypothetical protein
MNKKIGFIALVAGAALAWSVTDASACCFSPCSTRAFAGACRASCAPVACAPAPAPVVKKKIMVTQYVPQPYETTRTVYKTEYKEEKYTAYKCETVPEEHTRKVTYCKSIPETKDQVVTRYECVPTEVERDVTRMVYSTKQVTTMVNRCVDKGGHYECREVPCASHRCGLFHRSCDDCCAPATKTVSVYVPNMVTEQVPVTTCQRVCTPVTEKVKCTVYKSVPKQETIKVTTCKLVYETKDEKCIVNVVKRTPYEATRKVAVCVPVQEKVMCTRMVPVQVEKEVVCAPTSTCSSCGGRCGLLGGLFHRGGCN